MSNPNSNPRRKLNDILHPDPYPLRTMHDYTPYNFNTWLESVPPTPGFNSTPLSRDPVASRQGYTMQPPASQRDASAYSAAMSPVHPRRSRSPPGVVMGGYPSMYPVSMPPPPPPSNVRRARSPLQTPPGPRKPYGSPPRWVDFDTSLSGPVRSPPPAYSTFNHVGVGKERKRGMLDVAKGGLVAGEEVKKMGAPRISRVQFESGKGVLEEKEKEREQAREALRLRDEGRREAERVRIERERKSQEGEGVETPSEELQRYEAQAKVIAEIVNGKLTAGRKQEEGVEDVRRAFEELKVDEEMGGCQQGEEEWEVLEKPDVGDVMADDCVDSDDSDTWC